MQALNYTYGEAQANNADSRTRALYQDLYSPQAKMLQLQEAGLNPALMYSGAGGAGGQSSTAGAQGSNVSVGTPHMERLDIMQGALMASEIALNKAKGREADAKASESNSMVAVNEELKNHYEKSATKLSNESKLLIQKLETEKHRTQFEKANAGIMEIKETIQEQTINSDINAIINENNKRAQELRKLTAEATREENLKDISKKEKEIIIRTAENQIKQSNINTSLLIAKTLNEFSKGKLNQAEITKIAQEIEEITQNIKWKEEDIKVRREKIEAEIKNAKTIKSAMLWQAGINVIGKLADIAVSFIH